MSQDYRHNLTTQDGLSHQADEDEFQSMFDDLLLSSPFEQAGAMRQIPEHTLPDPLTMADAGYIGLPDRTLQGSYPGENRSMSMNQSSNHGFSYQCPNPCDGNSGVSPTQESSMSSTLQGPQIVPKYSRAHSYPQPLESLPELDGIILTPRNPSNGPWDPLRYTFASPSSEELEKRCLPYGGPYSGYAPANIFGSLVPVPEPPAYALTPGVPGYRAPHQISLYPVVPRDPFDGGGISRPGVAMGGLGVPVVPTIAESILWSLDSQSNVQQSSVTSLTSPSTPSVISETPSGVADRLTCPFSDCGATFTGKFRRGNLGRHRRMFHDCTSNTNHPCGVNGCTRVYRRSDALRKHRMIRHPRARTSSNLCVPDIGYS